MATLPFKPEPFARLKRRLPLALVREWDSAQTAKAKGIKPHILRPHVFDFELGVRLVVSVDYAPCTCPGKCRKGHAHRFVHVMVSPQRVDPRIPSSDVTEAVDFILLSFFGNRELLDQTPSKCQNFMHFFYAHPLPGGL